MVYELRDHEEKIKQDFISSTEEKKKPLKAFMMLFGFDFIVSLL